MNCKYIDSLFIKKIYSIFLILIWTIKIYKLINELLYYHATKSIFEVEILFSDQTNLEIQFIYLKFLKELIIFKN